MKRVIGKGIILDFTKWEKIWEQFLGICIGNFLYKIAFGETMFMLQHNQTGEGFSNLPNLSINTCLFIYLWFSRKNAYKKTDLKPNYEWTCSLISNGANPNGNFYD